MTGSMRKAIFWLHLAAGCVGGAVILLMSLTGVLLMYERQILARVERGPFRVAPPAPDARPLPLENLLLAVKAVDAELAAGGTLTVRSDPAEPVEISVGREGSVFVDPYTGRILGRPSGAWRQFFRNVTAWHRWLGMEGGGRTAAKAITGACNLAFLGMIVSGVFLWLPRKWSRRALAPVVWFRGGTSGKARDFNWHNVFGFWCAVPLLIIVITAAPMSYTWANDLLYRLSGSEPVRFGAPGGRGEPGRREGRPGFSARRDGRGGRDNVPAEMRVAGLNRLWERAVSQQPGWQSISVRMPDSQGRPVSFAIDAGSGGEPQKRSTLSLDRQTAAVISVETFAGQSTGRRLRSLARFLHTGEALGIAGQTVAGVASAAAVMLVWTGISLSWRRLMAWRSRRRTRQPEMAGKGLAA